LTLGIAVALKQAASPEFKTYAKQIRANAVVIADTLKGHGYKLVTDGTVNHLVLWDLRPNGINGGKMEKMCDAVNITLNKNAVHGDVSAFAPGGVRVGLSPLTSRSVKEKEAAQIAEFLHESLQLALKIQASSGKLMKDFVAALVGNEEVKDLRARVKEFAMSLPMPGFDPSSVPAEFRH
jgi:glycine hydroxymethyltransferase